MNGVERLRAAFSPDQASPALIANTKDVHEALALLEAANAVCGILVKACDNPSGSSEYPIIHLKPGFGARDALDAWRGLAEPTHGAKRFNFALSTPLWLRCRCGKEFTGGDYAAALDAFAAHYAENAK